MANENQPAQAQEKQDPNNIQKPDKDGEAPEPNATDDLKKDHESSMGGKGENKEHTIV